MSGQEESTGPSVETRLELVRSQLNEADAALDTAGIVADSVLVNRVRALVQQRDAANTQAASREAIFNILRSERDLARSQLRQIKLDLMAMGRLEKLACALVMGDASPDDVGEDGQDEEL